MTTPDYTAYFPFPTVRAEQRQAIDFALDAFLVQKKRFVILEAGTGVGKSGIAVAIARYLAARGGPTVQLDDTTVPTTGAYVITTQKILQAQYMDDFGPASGRNMMLSLKSASNYNCTFYADMRCSDSRRLMKQLGKAVFGTDFHKCCASACPYKLDKEQFIQSPLGITNFSYFLAETMYAKQLVPRSLLVIDECHNVESELGKFIEVSFSEKFARTLGCRSMPAFSASADAVLAWIKGPYKKALQSLIGSLKKKMSAQFGNDTADKGLTETSKRYETLDKHICKVNRFITTYDPKNWVMNPVKGDARGGRKFEFKPVDVSPYSYEHLYKFGSRVLLMSATIVNKDTFCRSVGIDPNEAAFIHVPSPFPPQNRPIHYLGVGSMSKDCIDQTLPNVVQVVKDLLELHKDEKGIIHCVNYRVAQFIVDHAKSPRLLLHDSANRDQMITFHIDNPDPTVLVSPSMTEGVDLADDASRFQILCKVPFPYLGDPVIQMRRQRNANWYACSTARTVIQAFGRSIRNEDDHATSYILDSDWQKFFRTNSAMFPPEFVAALQA